MARLITKYASKILEPYTNRFDEYGRVYDLISPIKDGIRLGFELGFYKGLEQKEHTSLVDGLRELEKEDD